jgi:hypothetical protein
MAGRATGGCGAGGGGHQSSRGGVEGGLARWSWKRKVGGGGGGQEAVVAREDRLGLG